MHLPDICIDWNVTDYYSILPINWSPCVRYFNQPTTFADLERYPTIATIHPLYWTGKYAEELRRFTKDTRSPHAREQGLRLLLQTAIDRCAQHGKDGAAEITTGDIRNALAKWRSGLRMRAASEMPVLRQDLAHIVKASTTMKEDFAESEETGESHADLDGEVTLELNEEQDEDGEGGVMLSSAGEVTLPARVKTERIGGPVSGEMGRCTVELLE
jgi:hypothetical protein